GGQVLIGGDYQGKNPNVHNAKATYIGRGTTIKADAKTHGDGGKVIAWADNTTRAYGSISTKGGTQSGNGGFIETSGHQYLDVEGIRVNASAANGAMGNWLLDPNNIKIIHATGTSSDANISVANPFAPSLDTTNSTISDYTINQALSGYAIVSLTTSSTGTAGTGDILFDGSNGAIVLSKNSADAFSTTLTFNAFNNIKFLSSSNTTIETTATTGTGNLITVFNPGTGKVIVESGATLSLNGQGSSIEAQLSGGKIWENSGTINMLGKSVIRPYLSSLSTFDNLTGGVLNIGTTGDWSFLSNSGNQEGIVNNAGTINVNQSTSWEAKFSQVAGGILNLHSGLSMQHLNVAAGTINIDSGITLWIPENHSGLNKFDGTSINGPGRLQIGYAVSSYSPTVNFNNVSTSVLTLLREEKGSLAFSGTNTFANTKFFANGTSNTDWIIPTATYTGNTEWWAKGNITLNNNLSTAGNMTLGAGWNANIATPASTSTGTITHSAALSAANVIFKAGKMALAGGTINGSSSVSLLSTNAIDLGAGTTDLLSTLELSNAELNTITTPILRIGDISSGAIDIKSALALANISTALNLTSGGAITQQAGATIAAVPGLNLSGTLVTLTEANSAGVISGSASAGDFRYRSSSLLTIATVDGVSGITAPSANNIALESGVGINQQTGANLSSGGLALKIIGSVNLLNSGNNIAKLAADLTSGTGNFDLFSGSNLAVTSLLSADGVTTLNGITTNNQSIRLVSNALSIGRPINAGTSSVDLTMDTLTWDAANYGSVVGGQVDIRPYTAGRPITVGAACIGGTGTCLSITELWKVSSPVIGIGNDTAGAIFVSGITYNGSALTDRNTTTTRIGLISNSGVTQSTTAINVQDLGIEANGTVLLNAVNNITNLAAKTLGHNFTFVNGQGFTVTQMSGGTTNSTYNLNGIDTCSISGGCSNVASTGDIHLTAGGLLTIGAGGIRAGDDMTLVASGNIVQNGALSVGLNENLILATTSGNYINTVGSGALNVSGTGRWLVYSNSPTSNTLGGLTPSFKHYGCQYATGCTGYSIPTTGNGLLYSITPVLHVAPWTASSTYGSPISLAGLGYTLTGYIDGDTVTSADIAGTAIFSTDATASSSTGSYNIIYNAGLGNNMGYFISDDTGNVAEYTIMPKSTIVTEELSDALTDSTNEITVTEELSNTLVDSTNKTTAGVLGTTLQSGQLLTNELGSSNNSTDGSAGSSVEKGKKLQQCTK
ncbi:MAG: hypothetical protein Q8L79_06645, partial [Methylobacter sp.]|uniref:beta strand repeat-containing protein n=1 Tax=Methylobacter sp. TaxID=2051955 RepID=UPI00274B2504|nr:hypothetical protein [Methylobacter sp.]